jgi:F-box protein 36
VSIRSGDAGMRWPVEIKNKYRDFVNDDQVQREIKMIFGRSTLHYILNIVEKGKLDYLARLPENLLLKIVSFLPLEDISRLSQTNSLFRQVAYFWPFNFYYFFFL